jgi:heat shock protein HslJ
MTKKLTINYHLLTKKLTIIYHLLTSKLFIAGIFVLSLFACNSNQPQTATGDNSQTSLDWDGTYTGMTPCADCEGIETTVTLNKDMTYQLSNNYKGKSTDAIMKTGTFSFNKDGNSITLGNITDGPSMYAVGENQLIQLDMQGNKITGDLSEKYILKKGAAVTQRDELANTEWELVELMGKPVEQKMPSPKPLGLKFNNDGRVSGFVGCNSVGGTYEVIAGSRIKFSQLLSTMMACDDLDIENEYKKVLETADNYNLSDTALVLNRARMAPMARFKKLIRL